jgi:hypothetical protein
MNRRTALAIAAAAGGTVLTATAAFATNVGLLDNADEPPMSVLDSSALVADDTELPTDPTVVTIVVEDPPAAVAPAPTAPAPVSSPAVAPASDDSDFDDPYDDDVYDDHGEDDDDEDEDHEDEDHEDEDDD